MDIFLRLFSSIRERFNLLDPESDLFKLVEEWIDNL
jgi:hypothetical protein